MNFLKGLFGGNNATSSSESSAKLNLDWKTYRAGELDKAGRTITKVHAVDADYVIYFSGCELYYETTLALRKDLGNADAALAQINRLLDAHPKKDTREYNINLSTLELAADAVEIFFCGERTEALAILNDIRDKLQAKEEGQRRLTYQLGTVLITVVVWILYLWFQRKDFMPAEWYPWILAAALAMAGGLFSVCLSIGSLEVNVNQQKRFLLCAGATRSIVALLAGIGLLLAMRSKMFAGIIYKGSEPLLAGEALGIAEMFFCFLAGFSESFVPNILSKSADAKAADAKAVADKAAADKAAADKAAADKAAAEPTSSVSTPTITKVTPASGTKGSTV